MDVCGCCRRTKIDPKRTVAITSSSCVTSMIFGLCTVNTVGRTNNRTILRVLCEEYMVFFRFCSE